MDIFTQLVALVGRITPEGLKLLGTAFLVSNDGRYATTRHVVGNDDKGLVILAPHIAKFNEYQDTSDNSCKPVDANVVEADPLKDIAILQCKNISWDGALPPVGSLDSLSIGDEVGVFGYPHCTDGRRVLTFQKAAIGAKVLMNADGVKSKHAIVNTQSRRGQSGSLVFAPSQQSIVGVLIGTYAPGAGILLGDINPAELNQTTHIISAEYLKEML